MMVGDAHVVSAPIYYLFPDTYLFPGILSFGYDRRRCSRDTTHGNPGHETGHTSKVNKVTKLLCAMLISNNMILSSRDPSIAFTSGQWMTEVSLSSILHQLPLMLT